MNACDAIANLPWRAKHCCVHKYIIYIDEIEKRNGNAWGKTSEYSNCLGGIYIVAQNLV